MVSIVDMDGRWGIGRKDSGGKTLPGTLDYAIKSCARLLSKECKAISEVDSFFQESAQETDSDKDACQTINPS